MRGGESRRCWVADVVGAAIGTRGAMHAGYAGRCGEAKCFMDVT